MSLHFTLKKFPHKASSKQKCGLPWGCILKPQAVLKSGPKQRSPVSSIPRCSECFAYINPYVSFTRDAWVCSLCSSKNPLNPESKYIVTDQRPNFPELRWNAIEYSVEDKKKVKNAALDISDLPVYIMVVDLTGNSTFQQSVADALLYALEALPPTCLFGLVVYSDTIGIYNLRSLFPSVIHIRIPPASTGPASIQQTLEIEEVISMSHFLVPLGNYKEMITLVIKSIPQLAIQSMVQNRGLGYTLKSLIDYLNLYEDVSNVRLMIFISGPPNYGIGLLDRHTVDDETGDENLLPCTSFYREEALRASKAEISIDLFAIKIISVAEDHLGQTGAELDLGLASIKFLALLTGGNLWLYDDTSISSLSEDMYGHLSREQGFHGILRIRTSAGFKVKDVYGVYHDPSSPHDSTSIYNLEGCHPHKSIAIDFEHTSEGFIASSAVIQIAFAYARLPALNADQTENHRMKITRLLRVFTFTAPIMSNLATIYSGVESNAVIHLLMHKIVRVRLDSGLEEARALVEDWFSVLVLRYNQFQHPKALVLDLSFSAYKNLSTLPYLVFALLKCQILQSSKYPSFADYWSYLHCLFSSLSSEKLQRCLYPLCLGFKTEYDEEPSTLRANKAALLESSRNIFLLDHYHKIILYYSSTEEKSVDNAPDPNGKITEMLKSIKTSRLVRPKLVVLSAEHADAIDEILVEEQNRHGISFEQFLEYIHTLTSKLSLDYK